MLTIVASMERELSPLKQAWGPGHGQGLRVIGIGPARAASAIEALLSSLSPLKANPVEANPRQAILLLGFTGAVDPHLKTGDLVLASRYHRLAAGANSPGGDPLGSLSPDPGMSRLADRAAANAGLPVSCGSSLTVDALVSEPAEKRRIHEDFSVTSVNMEDYAVATVVAQFGVPFLSARVVLDTTHQHLPCYLAGLSGSGSKAVFAMAAKPWRIPGLVSLYGQMRRAQHVLGRFSLAFVQEFMSGPEFTSKKENQEPRSDNSPFCTPGITPGITWDLSKAFRA